MRRSNPNGLTDSEDQTLRELRKLALVDLVAAKQVATAWLRASRSATTRARRLRWLNTVKNLHAHTAETIAAEKARSGETRSI